MARPNRREVVQVRGVLLGERVDRELALDRELAAARAVVRGARVIGAPPARGAEDHGSGVITNQKSKDGLSGHAMAPATPCLATRCSPAPRWTGCFTTRTW